MSAKNLLTDCQQLGFRTRRPRLQGCSPEKRTGVTAKGPLHNYVTPKTHPP